jgi:hypothetical protein
MKVIYIAGKYRDPRGEYYVRTNIRQAESAALFVWQHGGVGFCPHKNSAGLAGAEGLPEHIWLDGYLVMLHRCDALWAIDNWEDSEGAMVEVEEARKLGIPVLFNQDQVLDYLRDSNE